MSKKENNPLPRDRNAGKDNCALLIWGIPKSLRKKFKKACRIKKVKMKECVIGMIKNFIDV